MENVSWSPEQDHNSPITSLNELEEYLSNLQNRAYDSFATALNAQLAVVRYVKSPELIDSTFDLIIADFKKAVRLTDSAESRIDIQEKFSLIVQNYIFFLNAKMEYDKLVNRTQGEEILATAVSELANCVGKIANKSIDTAQIAAELISNINNDSLVTKIIRWVNKETLIKKSESEFYMNLKSLFAKLYKNRQFIGQSDLIPGLIERHAGAVSSSEMKPVYDTIPSIDQIKPSDTPVYIILALGVVSIVVRWIFYLIRSTGTSLFAAEVYSAPEKWIWPHLILVFSITVIFFYL